MTKHKFEDLEPKIFRQRLSIEGKYRIKITDEIIKEFLNKLAKQLNMLPLTPPFIFSPNKLNHPLHHGIAGFIPWAESGASVYTWKFQKFFTVDIYTCKGFDIENAVEFTKGFFKTSKITYKELKHDIKSTIQKIKEALKTKLEYNTNILSATVVGSLSKERKLEKINDFDFVIIAKNIDNEEIKNIKKLANELKETYETKDLGITYTFDIGPVKIMSKKNKTLMLHFLIYPEKEYKIKESKMVRHSFQKNKPLFGKHLKEINFINQIKTIDLFSKIDGFPRLKNIVNQGLLEYLRPVNGELKQVARKITQKEKIDNLLSQTIHLTKNMLTVKGHDLNQNNRIYDTFKKEFKFPLNGFPKTAYLLKKELRNNQTLSSEKEAHLQNQFAQFIEQCKLQSLEDLQKNYLKN